MSTRVALDRRRSGSAGCTLALVIALACPEGAAAQPIYASSEPTVCTTVFRPISGLTFHAGGAFRISWFIPSSTFGPVTYVGQPDPAISEGRTKKWVRPTANVTCFIDWFQLYPTPQLTTQFRWHINFYGGEVVDLDCDETTKTPERSDVYAFDYDPSVSVSTSEDGCGGTGGDGEGSGTQYQPGDLTGGETVDWETGTGNGGTSSCGNDARVEYICIDVWVEGIGWVEWSCGYVTTC